MTTENKVIYTHNEFDDKYEPVENAEGSDFFETYGADLTYAEKIAKELPNKIWTILEFDGNITIVPGFHIVNRIGYCITKHDWEHENIEVYYDTVE